MQDQPAAKDLVTAVREFIETVAMPKLEGHAGFHARVAANALAIVERELAIAPVEDAHEAARLNGLLDRFGTLRELNDALCNEIREGHITLETPGLADHLWKTTLTKLAIDQPRYAAYKRAMQESAS
ncbi:DUF6285 domain-containing protein [Pyruvatibacter sp.]|uniref:DUF6285 domain-containing protein n=1 Tax=Pyruvatibacter sp. TaxID=1981328 RepID=UPI0032EDFDAD